MCGGTGLSGGVAQTGQGLSPRVRGNPLGVFVVGKVLGSIPACAGEPGPVSGGVRTRGVYPRVCGGTRRPGRPGPGRRGLSPRVRGNLVDPNQFAHRLGSIPACAGEPGGAKDAAGAEPVYPRVCGGTTPLDITGSGITGLSPRVRGNLIGDDAAQLVYGSIPACAGEPDVRGGAATRIRVYPRVCGGTKALRVPTSAGSGLSPRVRGNRTAPVPACRGGGSIPACAGEPPSRISPSRTLKVYPRVCGGTSYGR